MDNIGEVGGIIGNSYGTHRNYITNCYNVGNISGSVRIGTIVGQAQYTTLTNCYWLSGKGAMGENSGGNVTCNGGIDKENFKVLAEQLGDAFTDDVQNSDGTWKYNNGNPILKWQLEK